MLKVRRAHDHIQGLHGAVNEFLGQEPFKARYEYNWDEHVVDVIAEVAGDQGPAEALRWGISIGDVVHDLRSALDHLVWKLAEKEQGGGPTQAPPGPWRDTGFPILSAPGGWKSVAGQKLRLVSASLRGKFEDLQPFRTNPSDPAHEPLAVLEELWKVDKHRAITVTRVVGEVKEAEERMPFPELGPGQFVPELIWSGPQEFVDGQVLAKVRVNPGRMLASTIPEWHAQVKGTLDVVFADEPAAQQPLFATLTRLHHEVAQVLRLFEGDLS